jgi:hypothetical protein
MFSDKRYRVGQMPFMHGVRILGINSTVGIDDHLMLSAVGDKRDKITKKDQ